MPIHHRLPAALAALTVLAACAHRPAERIVNYACDSGQRIVVHYRGTNTAVVEMPPRAFVMKAADAPVGRRYAGRQLQWVVEAGDGASRGTLFTTGYAGGPGKIAERCRATGRP